MANARERFALENLIGANDPAGQARLTAQAREIEAYERVRSPQPSPALAQLLWYHIDHCSFLAKSALTRYDQVGPV